MAGDSERGDRGMRSTGWRNPEEQHERNLVLDSIRKAFNSRECYVMLNLPVMRVKRRTSETMVVFDLGMEVELILGRSRPSFIDEIIRREKFRISYGGLEYLGSKYLPMGTYENFDNLEAASSRFAQLLDEVSAYRVSEP